MNDARSDLIAVFKLGAWPKNRMLKFEKNPSKMKKAQPNLQMFAHISFEKIYNFFLNLLSSVKTNGRFFQLFCHFHTKFATKVLL